MKSVISKLYNGEIFPAETVVPTDSGYRSSVNKVGQEINGLQEVLTREQYKKLERDDSGWALCLCGCKCCWGHFWRRL